MSEQCGQRLCHNGAWMNFLPPQTAKVSVNISSVSLNIYQYRVMKPYVLSEFLVMLPKKKKKKEGRKATSKETIVTICWKAR